MASNFPPGHPTGIQTTEGHWAICRACEQIQERNPGSLASCANCKEDELEILKCEECDQPAEVERYERDVNAASYFCKQHMR